MQANLMRFKVAGLCALAIGAGIPGAARADEAAAARPAAPAVYAALAECRKIADAAPRLACFDARVAELDVAVAQAEVVIADRSQIREARKGLFGLSLPSLDLFGGKGEEIEELVDSVVRYGYDGSGRAYLVLANGSRWQQTEVKRVRIREGAQIRIRRAAMGSYLANIDGATAVRVKRIAD